MSSSEQSNIVEAKKWFSQLNYTIRQLLVKEYLGTDLSGDKITRHISENEILILYNKQNESKQ